MLKIDLVNSDASDLRIKIIQFNDGQQDVRIVQPYDLSDEGIIVIKARLNSFTDIELLYCLLGALERLHHAGPKELWIPYLLGARSDRVFEMGAPHYLADVIGPVINAMMFDRVYLLDPHSPVALAVIDRSEATEIDAFLDRSEITEYLGGGEATVIAPDAGGIKRASYAAEIWESPVIAASKQRDVKTGKILGVQLPTTNFGERPVVVVDDLCDGGRTFIELAKVIETCNPGDMFLVVTHGIFSQGTKELLSFYDKIFTTNSYSEQEGLSVDVFDVYSDSFMPY